MDFIRSIQGYFGGILKKAYYWAPAILLDPFDIYNKYIRPLMPKSLRGTVDMPSEWFPWVFMAGVTWAGLMTYYELKRAQHKDTSTQPIIINRVVAQQATTSETAFVGRLHDHCGQILLLWLPSIDDKFSSADRSMDGIGIKYSKDVRQFDRPLLGLGAGAAISFNGRDEHAVVEDPHRFSFGDGRIDSPFSVIALVKPTGTGKPMNIVSKWGNGGGEWGLVLNSDSSFAIKCDDIENLSSFSMASAPSLDADTWALVGVSYDYPVGGMVYLNKNGRRIEQVGGVRGTYKAMGINNSKLRIGAGGDNRAGSIAMVLVTALSIRDRDFSLVKEAVNEFFGLQL